MAPDDKKKKVGERVPLAERWASDPLPMGGIVILSTPSDESDADVEEADAED